MSRDTKEKVTSVDSIKKCPVCAGELKQGYLNAYRGLFWETEKHLVSDGLENFAKLMPFTPTHFPALRCSNCHIIVFDYQNRE
jgi:hypothetical protein